MHLAARSGALVGAGETVASRDTVDGAEGTLQLSQPRLVELKGIRDQVEVVTIGWS